MNVLTGISVSSVSRTLLYRFSHFASTSGQFSKSFQSLLLSKFRKVFSSKRLYDLPLNLAFSKTDFFFLILTITGIYGHSSSRKEFLHIEY